MRILVYADEGVSSFSLNETLRTFNTLSIDIHPVRCQKIINEQWEKETDLLIIPGGKDIPYHKKLKNKGVEKIRKFVENGGRYIGICAGAYFASSQIIFERKTPLEIYENRDLQFFPGSAIGSIYESRNFSYESETGAHASEISYKEDSLHLYYNGGCMFYQADNYPSVKILARYKDAGNQPAIIHCKVGKGNALLSGVHFEISPCSLSKKEYSIKMLKKLEDSNKKRQKLISSLLEHL